MSPSLALCGNWLTSTGLVKPLVPYMTTPSLWKPGAVPMTVVDFLSTWSSPGFPFCGHHSGSQGETVPRYGRSC